MYILDVAVSHEPIAKSAQNPLRRLGDSPLRPLPRRALAQLHKTIPNLILLLAPDPRALRLRRRRRRRRRNLQIPRNLDDG